MRPTVAIVGLGLVGGSLARALTLRGYPVVGVDRSAATRRAAKRARALVAATPKLAAALRVADIVVLAAPPEANLALLRRVARATRRRPIVTDVSSAKRRICSLGETLAGIDFVGGHPMAGRERSGFAASDPALFHGRPWILTPAGSRRALRAVQALARDVGARPVVLSASEHDRAIAFLSHLPQIVAWGLRDAARRDRTARRNQTLAGPAFADMTRIARSPRGLWRQILGQNRDELARALRAFRAVLASLSATL